MSATYVDEGGNGGETYDFDQVSEENVELLSFDPKKEEIRVVGSVDYEEGSSYDIQIRAMDGPGLTSCSVLIIEITDINDNAPVKYLKSLNNPIPEIASLGTEVGIINVQDRDSENNRQVHCSIRHNVPFNLVPSIKNYYSLVTTGELDRELVSDYNISNHCHRRGLSASVLPTDFAEDIDD